MVLGTFPTMSLSSIFAIWLCTKVRLALHRDLPWRCSRDTGSAHSRGPSSSPFCIFQARQCLLQAAGISLVLSLL